MNAFAIVAGQRVMGSQRAACLSGKLLQEENGYDTQEK